ncbi:MAG: hypothetical protein WCQ50_20080 [Spirochaetota bacterium]
MNARKAMAAVLGASPPADDAPRAARDAGPISGDAGSAKGEMIAIVWLR